MMNRYKISNELKEVIRKNPYGTNGLRKLAGFEIKNFYRLNKSINENQLNKLKELLNINPVLEEYIQDYAKNLGKYSETVKTKKLIFGEELAEFCGIMLGDGYFYKRGVRIAFDKRCVGYINYVNNLFEKLTGVMLKLLTIKTTNQAYLYFYGTKFAQELSTFGLITGNKIENNVGIPSWIKENNEYSKMCIRGLIDTDGCVYICKRERRKYIKFTNFNRRLLLEFKELALKLGYHFASANRKNVCLYRKDEVARFINEIKPVRAGQGL